MPGTYQYDVEIKSNVAKLLSDMKQVQDRLDTVEGKEYKIKLNVDEKKLSSVISNLEKMLDSLGKGTGDFKQLENLSKELSAITSEVKDFSKAFGKLDDSGAKTLLSSIQSIDRSLSDLSQHILNVNKNMSNMGGNTSGSVKQVENISNAYQDAAKEAEKLADAQSKIGQKTNISSGIENSTVSAYDNVVDRLTKILELRQKIAQSPTLENGLEGKGEFLKFAEQYKWSPYKDAGFLGESNIKAGYGIYTKAQTKFAKGEVDETYVNNAYTTFVKILTDNLVHSVSGITTGKTDVDYIKQRLQEMLPKKMSSFIDEYLDNITSFSKRNAEYNSGGNYIDEESKALKELIELGSGVNQRAEDIFTIDAKDDLQNLFDETKISAENFQSVLESVCNILGIEIPQNTEKAKESIKEVASTTDSLSSASNPAIEQQIKSESELNTEIEKRENIIRELQQLQEKLTVHEDFHGNDKYFADQLPTEEEIREADKRIKQLTGTNNIFDVDKLIQDRNEWLSEVKYSLEEYDNLIEANNQKALNEYTTRGLSHISGAESFFGYEDNNFSIASKFVEEKEKIQNEINDLYIDLDKLDEKMNLDSNNSSVDNTVQSQEKLQSELKETQEQAEKTAQAIEDTTFQTNQIKNTETISAEQFTKIESLFESIKESLSSIKSVLVDVGDGEELSPLLKTIDNINTSIINLNSDVLYSDTEKKYWTQVSSAIEQITKTFNEMKAASNTNPLENTFGKTDLTEVISQLNTIVNKLDEISISANKFLETFKDGLNITTYVEEITTLTNKVKELETELEIVKSISATTTTSSASTQKTKDAFQTDNSDASTVQKVADNFKEVKQNTDDATKATEKYKRVLSQVGELGVDAKISAMYQRNDGQLESVSWKAKRDDQGQILYDKDGNIDYDVNMTVISKYEQLEKIITTADNKLRDLKKSLQDTQNLNPNASTDNIEKQIQYQEDYIKLLEQTVKAISQQDEYLLYEQQIIDARAKAEKEYNLNQGTKSDISNAKQLASEESKRQKAIEQTNRLLNRQQITIDNIEKSYNKTINPDLDKSVSDVSDLSALATAKSEIQNLINQLSGQERNSSNEQEFLKLEKLISAYKQLAKDKLKANNPSKQELGGQDLKVLLEQQVSQYNQLISKAEKYGDATSDIVEKLKAQRDLIAQANSDGVYTAKSGLKADDYYSARDNYKITKAQFSSYETDIKNTEKLIQAQKELGDATTKARQAAKDSTQSSVDNALKEQVTAWKNIQSIREKIAKTKDTDEIARLQQIKKEYQQNYIEADKILKSNSSLYDKEIQVAKLEQIRVDTNKKIADYNDKQISGYDTRLESYTKKTSGYNATIARFNDGGWTSDTYLKNVQAVKNAVNEYETLLNELKGKDASLVTSEDISNLDNYEKKIKDTIATVTNMSAAEKGYNFVSGQKELDKIHKLLAENSKMSSEAKAKIRAYYAQIESGNPSMSLDKIHGEILKIYNAEVEAGRAGRTLWDTLKNSGFHQIAAQMAGMFGFDDAINLIKEGINTVRELDSAMTEVRKVSDATEAQYASFRDTISSTAKEIASTNKELLNSSADFLRLGYSLDQASDLAKNATLFVNVGDGVDITEATEDMITAMKAFDIQAEDSIKIVDDYNQIGKYIA